MNSIQNCIFLNCTWQNTGFSVLFVVNYCEVCKQDTLPSHYISCVGLGEMMIYHKKNRILSTTRFCCTVFTKVPIPWCAAHQ